MQKLEQIDKKLKCSEEDWEDFKKEVRHNKNENLYNYFTISRATEDTLLQMAERVEQTDKEWERFIKKDVEDMKKRYKTVNGKLWSL